MSDVWEDFSRYPNDERNLKKRKSEEPKNHNIDDDRECDWGQKDYETPANDGDSDNSNQEHPERFVILYEKYLDNKAAYAKDTFKTKNHSKYVNNPRKALNEYFDNQEDEMKVNFERQTNNETDFICKIDIPVEDQDFTIYSEPCKSKGLATEEACIIACKLLDQCGLLYNPFSSNNDDKDVDVAALAAERKRQFSEANKEDDIEFDNSRKKVCDISSSSQKGETAKVNTYESLMKDWKELNMSILMHKSKLVKIDLSISKNKSKNNSNHNKQNVDEEEVDPLDEFMLSLDKKTELSFDEKIQKTRIRAEIADLEAKQTEVARLIELAKPTFDLNKVSQNKCE